MNSFNTNVSAENSKHITAICNATGWNEEKANEQLMKATSLGMKEETFVSYKCWEFTDDELREFYNLLKLNNKKVLDTRRYYTKIVCEKTGWTYEYAAQLMKIAREKGYTSGKFITMGLWTKTEDEIKKLPDYVSKITPSQQEEKDARNSKWLAYQEIIMKEMNWSPGRVRIEALRSNIMCGTNNIEFFIYKIYKLGIDAGKKFITQECNEKMVLRYGGWGEPKKELLENKGLFNQTFSKFVNRKWFLNTNLSFDEFEKNIIGLNKIIYKPLFGLEGRGIEIYHLDDTPESHIEVYNKINNGKPAIIEEFIKQHEEISAFYPNAVNCIRVMSFLENGEGKILNSVIKFSVTSNVDNLFQGGVAAGIDEKTGIICTDGVDKAGNTYKYHPYSQKEFKGFQIPHWNKVIEFIKEAAAVNPKMPYVGWDIAITENGPVIIEGNHNQAAFLVQYPFAIYANEGRRHTLEKYLLFD